MTLKLNGRQIEKLCEALTDAFTPETLARMIRFKLSRKLEAFTSYGNRGTLETIVFELVSTAERGGWFAELVMGAHEAAPGNALLFAFAQPFSLTSLRAMTEQELERTIRSGNAMLEPSLFREQLGAHEPRVCRIEITLQGHSAFGTGFLITPDVVMTNFHVVETLAATRSAAGAARFDYHNLYQDGKLLRTNEGRRVDFHADWLLDFSPSAPNGSISTAQALDYALVKLAESPGKDILNGAIGREARTRGWIKLSVEHQVYEAGSSIFILQHPSAEPLKLAMDTQSVLGLYDGETRVRYTTNTERGSSGSPCFTPGWVLTALHHSGDPNFDPANKPTYNEGIPIAAIRRLIETHGCKDILTENERPERD